VLQGLSTAFQIRVAGRGGRAFAHPGEEFGEQKKLVFAARQSVSKSMTFWWLLSGWRCRDLWDAGNSGKSGTIYGAFLAFMPIHTSLRRRWT